MAHHTRCILAALLTSSGGFSLSSCATHPPKHPGQHPQFDTLDTDKDGKLSYEEIMKTPFMRKSSDPGSLFTKMDSNGDGSISLAEFRDYRVKNKKK